MIDWSKPLEVQWSGKWMPVVLHHHFPGEAEGGEHLVVFLASPGCHVPGWFADEDAPHSLRNTPSVEPVEYTAETWPTTPVRMRGEGWIEGCWDFVAGVRDIGIVISGQMYLFREIIHKWEMSEDGRIWHRACANWRELEGKA